MNNKILLSICVPTFNRVNLLKVMLECLLPQTERFKKKVEVIVCDNHSTDSTESLLEELSSHYTFRSFRQEKNNGFTSNIVLGATKLAKGDFVWLLGDHNLVAKGAIEHLVAVLEQNTGLDALYTNFRCAKYPEHWPESAHDGYDGPFHYYNNEDFQEYFLPQWHNLIAGRTALCTQIYAHILKSGIWRSYWENRPIPDLFTSGIGAYPHTYMLSQTVFNKPSYYIGRPLITIFNGAQHWGDLDIKAKVYTLGLPELIREFQKQKLPSIKIKEAKNFNKQQISAIVKATLESKDFTLVKLFRKIINGKGYFLIPTFFSVYLTNSNDPLPRLSRKIRDRHKNLSVYFKNWRPTRWIKRFINNAG